MDASQREAQGPVTGVTPHLTIRGQRGSQAAEWYIRAFGGEELMRMPAEDGVRLMHCHLRINGGSLMLNDDFPEYHSLVETGSPTGVTLHLQVDDPDAVWERALAAGAEATMPLADQFWGDRYGQLRDPFGHRWSIGGPVKG
jgi:PhnB protein